VSSGAHPIVKEPIPVSISHHAVVTPPLWRGDDAVERVLNNLMERRLSSPSSAPWSCQTYARLLAGESVSWGEILREHPLLGSITVRKLVEAGAVQATLIDDPQTATTDIWLTRQSRANGEDGRMTRQASREPLPISEGPAESKESSERLEAKIDGIVSRLGELQKDTRVA